MSCHSPMIGEEFTLAQIAETARKGRLLSMEIEFSLRCNFDCQYCYVGQNGSGDRELSQEECRDAILQAKELGARKIIILGGEPMIYPHILPMLDFIRGQDLAVEMFTNGTHITPETARRLFDLGVQVVLKMNSFEEKVQDELAGMKGAFKIIQQAFINLRAAGFPAEGHILAVSTIICAQNLKEVVPLWQWLRDQKITPYFEIMTPQGNALDNSRLHVGLPVLRKIFEELSELDRTRYGYAWDPQPPLVGNRCFRHQFSCLLNAYGQVMPCVGVTIPVGNIREQKLAAILRDSEVIQDLRRHTETIRGPCALCEKAKGCYGCRGAAYQMTGDYLASDPLCWKNAGREQEILTLPVAVDGLIPHQPPMRVVDRLLSVGERVAVVETTLQNDSPFARSDGSMDPSLYLELVAQAAAVMNGFKPTRLPGQVKGYLIGARNLEARGMARVGDTLTIRVFKATRYGAFGIIEGQIFRGDELLAQGEIKVWHTSGTAQQAAPVAP
ncbi:MAG: radical SAM protein [Lentisphaerota bacterium]